MFSKNQCIITINIIGCTVLGRPFPPQVNVASDLYPGHLPSNFYKPASFRLPLPRKSISISVGHVLVERQDLSTISFYLIRFHPFTLYGQPTSVYWILNR